MSGQKYKASVKAASTAADDYPMVLEAAQKLDPNAPTLRAALTVLQRKAWGLYSLELRAGTMTPREAVCTVAYLVLADVL